VGEAIVVLTPADGGGEEVGGGVGGAPLDNFALLEEFEMLVELAGDDGRKTFVAGQSTLTALDDMAGEHGEKGVFGEEFDHAAAGLQIFVPR